MTKKEIFKNILIHLSLLLFLTIPLYVQAIAISDVALWLLFGAHYLILRDIAVGNAFAKIFSDSTLKLIASIILTYIISVSIAIIMVFLNGRNEEGKFIHCTDCCGCMEEPLSGKIPRILILTLAPFIIITIITFIIRFSDRKKQKNSNKDIPETQIPTNK